MYDEARIKTPDVSIEHVSLVPRPHQKKKKKKDRERDLFTLENFLVCAESAYYVTTTYLIPDYVVASFCC